MKQTVRTYGRMELAQDDPQTASLATLSRRTFLPAEVSIIFSVLGVP